MPGSTCISFVWLEGVTLSLSLSLQVPDADYRPPWDIGRVQPAVVQAEAEGLFRGTVRLAAELAYASRRG